MDVRDDKGSVVLTRVFSREVTGAVFADENICFLVMRGVDKRVFLLAYLLAYDDRNGAIGADRSAAVCVDFDVVIVSAHGKYACLFHSVWKCVAGLVMIDDVLYLFLVVNMAASV